LALKRQELPDRAEVDAVGILYLVGTPIGNLEDMTMRAIATLQKVDLIAAEDTRHTGRLLQHFQITTPQISYHDHNSQTRTPELITKLQAGQAIALVSDAGMPAISDPGYELVQACVQAQIQVIPIPGVTAAIAAICASGLESQRFVFEGFLPIDNQARQTRLNALQLETRTAILYEAPHRLLRTLKDLVTALEPSRQIAIARELTKLHEEFWRGSLEDAIACFSDRAPKGEFTLVLAGASEPTTPIWTDEKLLSELQSLVAEGVSRSDASRQLAELTNLPRRQIYQLALTI
jgi:16S rRNA (cytidine1402-2'-O)-methyltransferase